MEHSEALYKLLIACLDWDDDLCDDEIGFLSGYVSKIQILKKYNNIVMLEEYFSDKGNFGNDAALIYYIGSINKSKKLNIGIFTTPHSTLW